MLDRRTLLASVPCASLLPLAGGPAAARAASGASAGPTVLTVSGNIDRTNDGGAFRFDRTMLEGLGVTRLKTSTAWTAESPEFEGVLVRNLLEAVGAHGSEVAAVALNDYVVTI